MDNPIRYRASLEQWTGGWFIILEVYNAEGEKLPYEPLGPFPTKRSGLMALEDFQKNMADLGAQPIKGTA